MKKMMKTMVSLLLALALTVSGITYTDKVEAATDINSWKANAVKVPAEGTLVGAGYIDVEFDNSMEGYTYTVFLDGKPVYWIGDDIVRTEIGEEITENATTKSFTPEDTGKTEVYTTGVSKHEITVKANDGTNEYVSDTRTFYVSKKGMALGGDMSDKISLKDLNCSWYYNWATEAFNNSIDKDVAHIPMMWGDGDDSKESIQNLNTTANYILGFNEPDIKSQANMFFYDAIGVWDQYIAPLNMRKISPAPASPGGTSPWLEDFMYGEEICKNPFDQEKWALFYNYDDNSFAQSTYKKVNGIMNDDNNLNDVDAVVLHYYQARIDLDGLKKAVKALWDSYHKPIWITEISVFGTKGTPSDYSYEIPEKRQQMAEFVEGIVEFLDSTSYVERYCWFSYDVDSQNEIDGYNGSGATSMFEYATGKYTALGKLYSRIGNPEGYKATDIQNTPDFEWEDRVRTEFNYNLSSDTVTVSFYTGDLDVARYELVIDDKTYSINSGETIDASLWEEGKKLVQVIMYDENEKVLYDKTKSFIIDRTSETTTEEETTTKKEETTTSKTPTNPTSTTVSDKETTKKQSKPTKVNLQTAVNVKKKSVKLTWKKISGAKKYQVQYALNKKFTKKCKTKTTKSKTIKITKLLKKKKYYFRVRAINSKGAGKWSNVKSVMIKK